LEQKKIITDKKYWLFISLGKCNQFNGWKKTNFLSALCNNNNEKIHKSSKKIIFFFKNFFFQNELHQCETESKLSFSFMRLSEESKQRYFINDINLKKQTNIICSDISTLK